MRFLNPKTLPSIETFDELSENDWEEYLEIDTYGDFQLTEAIRPSHVRMRERVIPSEGYRHDVYIDSNEEGDGITKISVLIISASREKLFRLFVELIEPLGEYVDVVLLSSHDQQTSDSDDLYQEDMGMPIVQSILARFENVLLHDGCTGVAVMNPDIPEGVQFDEHKLLMIYGNSLEKYEQILQRYDVPCNEQIRFVTEALHVHSTSEKYYDDFCNLRTELGLDV
jgi:hypothetical protein